MDRLIARGKFLFEGERKFRACGVSYGPFSPNSRGERYPEPERATQDFALMRELGANVVRSDIVRWHGARAVSRFVSELYDIGKSIAPDSLFTYSNYPSAEYLDLSFLDFICFNVYLHRESDFRRYLTHLMAATGERPLMLSETGMDTIREGEEP